MSFNCCCNFFVSIDQDLDVIHHFEIILLSQLLYFGDQFSSQTFSNQFVVQVSIQNCEYVVFHSYCETFFSTDSHINHIRCDFNVFTVQIQNQFAFGFQLCNCCSCVSFSQCSAECFDVFTQHWTSNFEVWFQAVVHELIQFFFEYYFLNVQLFHDQWSQVGNQIFVFTVNQDFRQWLSNLDLFFFTSTTAQRYHCSDQVHTFFCLFVDQRFVSFWIVS